MDPGLVDEIIDIAMELAEDIESADSASMAMPGEDARASAARHCRSLIAGAAARVAALLPDGADSDGGEP